MGTVTLNSFALIQTDPVCSVIGHIWMQVIDSFLPLDYMIVESLKD